MLVVLESLSLSLSLSHTHCSLPPCSDILLFSRRCFVAAQTLQSWRVHREAVTGLSVGPEHLYSVSTDGTLKVGLPSCLAARVHRAPSQVHDLLLGSGVLRSHTSHQVHELLRQHDEPQQDAARKQTRATSVASGSPLSCCQWLAPSSVLVGACDAVVYTYSGASALRPAVRCSSTRIQVGSRTHTHARMHALQLTLRRRCAVPYNRCTDSLPAHDDAVSALRYAPHAHTLVTGGTDTQLRLWKVRFADRGFAPCFAGPALNARPRCVQARATGFDPLPIAQLWDLQSAVLSADVSGPLFVASGGLFVLSSLLLLLCNQLA